MKNKINQQGFSLVQVMISVGLTGFLVLVMSKLNQQGIKTQKTLEARSDKQLWLQSIFLTRMKDSSACMNTFNKPTTRIDASKALTDLYQSDSEGGGVFFSVGDFLPSGDYSVSAMQSTGFVANSAGSPEGVCPLVLTFDVVNSSNDASNIIATQQTTETINFPCTVDRSNDPQLDIVNCSVPQGMNLNSFWDINFPPPGSDDFASWNPQGGVGNMIIGRPSDNTVAEDTASMNINLQGVQWSADTNANLWEGVTLNTNNAIQWGNDWVAGSNANYLYFGNNEISTMNDDTKLLFARGNLVGFQPMHITAYGLPIEVAGDIYADPDGASDGTDNYNYHMGMGTDGNDVYIDWNRMWKNYNFSGSGAISYNNTLFEYGAILRWNVVDARLDFYLSSQNRDLTPAELEQRRAYTIFADRRFIFSAREVTTGVPAGTESYTAPGSRYSFAMGEQMVTSGEHNMSIGYNNYVQCDHCLTIGASNTFDLANYSMIVGSNSETDGVSNFSLGSSLTNNGDFSFIGGRSGSASEDADFGLGFGDRIVIENPYEVSFGQFNETETSATDFTRFTIGDGPSLIRRRNMLALYNSGALRLAAHYRAWDEDSSRRPGDLFIIPPHHETAEPNDKALILGYNLFRRCGIDPTCDYTNFGGSTIQVGFSAALMDDENGVNFVVDNSASATSTRNELTGSSMKGSELDDQGYFKFAISGITTDKSVTVAGDLDIPGTHTLFCTGGASCPPAPSDGRIKKNIQSVKDKDILNKFKEVRPVSFAYKKSPQKKFFGFIAQEIKEIFPQIAQTNKKGFLTLLIQDFYALFVKGIKNFMELVEELEQHLFGQEERASKLEQELDQLRKLNRKLKEKYCDLSTIKKESLCKN